MSRPVPGRPPLQPTAEGRREVKGLSMATEPRGQSQGGRLGLPDSGGAPPRDQGRPPPPRPPLTPRRPRPAPQDLQIISTDESQVLVAVQEWHQTDTYNLYQSGPRGERYTLVLEGVRSSRQAEEDVVIDILEVGVRGELRGRRGVGLRGPPGCGACGDPQGVGAAGTPGVWGARPHPCACPALSPSRPPASISAKARVFGFGGPRRQFQSEGSRAFCDKFQNTIVEHGFCTQACE